MGLFDFIKDEFIEVIDWVESCDDTILWKFPDKDANIKYGANLTVRESQTAMFLDEGQLADVYEPGRHELITANMPLLTSLRSWKSGFKSPFLCDVFFVSTRTLTNLKWGTPTPIIMRDPEFKQVRVKAFGTYFVKVSDPFKFLTEYAGIRKSVKASEVEGSMRDLIAPKFAEALAETGVSVLDMVSKYSELGEVLLPILQKDFTPFGLELVKFQISSISLPEEVEAFYDKMTNMNMVGDMNKFQQFQQANAIEKAAENEGAAGEGVGMGMGFGMANMMINQNQNQGQNQQQPTSKAQTREEVLNTLKELGSLKEAGILTKAEFDAKKTELLARL